MNIIKHIEYETCRASGKGGQNVNKVETKVRAKIHISYFRYDEQIKLNHLINGAGYITSVSQRERNQLSNKKDATDKLIRLIEENLKEEKERISTEPSFKSKEKKIKDKYYKKIKIMNRIIKE